MKRYAWILVLTILSAHLMAADRYAPPAYVDFLQKLSSVKADDNMQDVLKLIKQGPPYDEHMPIASETPEDDATEKYTTDFRDNAYVNAMTHVILRSSHRSGKPWEAWMFQMDPLHKNSNGWRISRAASDQHLRHLMTYFEKAKMRAEQMRASSATKIQSIVRGRQSRKKTDISTLETAGLPQLHNIFINKKDLNGIDRGKALVLLEEIFIFLKKMSNIPDKMLITNKGAHVVDKDFPKIPVPILNPVTMLNKVATALSPARERPDETPINWEKMKERLNEISQYLIKTHKITTPEIDAMKNFIKSHDAQ